VSKEDDAIERLINEHQVADLIGVSVATVRRWRLHGRGPRYLKIGVLVRYCPRAVRAWLMARPTGGDSDDASSRQKLMLRKRRLPSLVPPSIGKDTAEAGSLKTSVGTN
jgi:predicted DNA-binding transcriptional regulator AlpA